MEPYEIELLRRSIAMLSPGALAIEREEALGLVQDLASIRAELEGLKQGCGSCWPGSTRLRKPASRRGERLVLGAVRLPPPALPSEGTELSDHGHDA